MASSGGHWSKGGFKPAGGVSAAEKRRLVAKNQEDEIKPVSAASLGVTSAPLPKSTRQNANAGPPAPFSTWAQKRMWDAAHSPTKADKRSNYRAKIAKKVRRGT